MPSTESLTDRCPWCETLIPRTKFEEIQQRIREEERKKLEKFRQDLEAEKRAIEKRAKQESEKRIASIVAERDRTLEKIKQLEAREAEIRKQAQQEAERKAKSLIEETEKRRQREVEQQRLILEKDRDQALLKQQANFNREREGYQKKFLEMERQLQRKTAQELGDGGEIDVFEALREAFPGDHISRIKKGQPGADILQEVLHKGEVCGRIVYDSKNRQAWQNAFATKLHEDQVATKADHGILSTTVFPSGKKELCTEAGVIVVSPARVVSLVELLRIAIIRMHVLGLSVKEREGKKGRLYKFITSEIYTQRFKEADILTQAILDLDVEEQRDHQNMWKKRGRLAMRLKNVLREIDTEISAIVEGTDEGEAA